MMVVYLCPTGTCSSLVAAHLHLGNLTKMQLLMKY